MPKFAANLGFLFPDIPFLDRFEAAARAGFRAVEYASPYGVAPEDIVSRLKECHLEQVLLNFPPGNVQAGERGLAAMPGREADFAETLEQALSYARALHCPRLHVMAGVPPADASRKECEAVYGRNLRMAAARLQPYGIRLQIEPLNTRDNPGYFLTTPAQAQRIMMQVDSDNLFLQMDLYHWQVMLGDLATNIRTYLPITEHVQIAGNPGRHEPDVGEVYYPYLFHLLDTSGYTGWIGCEYHPQGDTVAGLGWAQGYGLGVIS